MLAAAGSEDFVSAAAILKTSCFERGGSWTRVLLDAVLQDENICIRKAASGRCWGRPLPAAWTASWNFCSSSAALRWLMSTVARNPLPFCPAGKPRKWILPPLTLERLAEVGQKGYGMFARHHMFTIEDGACIPVRFPDPQR